MTAHDEYVLVSAPRGPWHDNEIWDELEGVFCIMAYGFWPDRRALGVCGLCQVSGKGLLIL